MWFSRANNREKAATQKREADSLREWRARHKEQLDGRTSAGFYPVPDRYYAKFNQLGEDQRLSAWAQRSFGHLQSTSFVFVPLRHSFLELSDPHRIGPSALIDDACRRLQIVLSAALGDVPDRVLLYLADGRLLGEEISQPEAVKRLEESDDQHNHPYVVAHSRLSRGYLAELSVGAFTTLTIAMSKLDTLGLMDGEILSGAAADYFFGLLDRKAALETTYQTMRAERAPL